MKDILDVARKLILLSQFFKLHRHGQSFEEKLWFEPGFRQVQGRAVGSTSHTPGTDLFECREAYDRQLGNK